MSDVTFTEGAGARPSASEALIAEAVSTVQAKDPKGRTYTLEKPGIIQQSRLVRIFGAENQSYQALILPLIYLQAIDDDRVMFPVSVPQVEALLKRLGDDGYETVAAKIQDTWGKVADTDGAIDEIKK